MDGRHVGTILGNGIEQKLQTTAGDLLADPEFLFVYDGVNGLVQVYERGTIDVDEYDELNAEAPADGCSPNEMAVVAPTRE